jgi:hypothetical protein
LYTATEIDENELSAAVKFWIHKGILRECTGNVSILDQCFQVVENQPVLDSSGQMIQSSLVSDKSGLMSLSAQSTDYDLMHDTTIQSQEILREKAAIKLVEEYVRSLLKSHGTMTLDRLFSSLQFLLQAAISDNSKFTTKDFHFTNQMISFRNFLQSIPDVDCLEGIYSLKIHSDVR